MGLASSPYAFWQLIRAVTFGMDNVLAYLDDLLTASKVCKGGLADIENTANIWTHILQAKYQETKVE